MTTQLTGGCQCGEVRYELTAQPKTEFCHCRMCQRATGGVFAALTSVPIERFRWTNGQPACFASSTVANRHFCRDCGTPLTWVSVLGKSIDVTVGSLDDPERAGPNRGHFAVESRVSWVPICDGAPEQRLDALPDAPVHKPDYQSFQGKSLAPDKPADRINALHGWQKGSVMIPDDFDWTAPVFDDEDRPVGG